MSGSLSCPGNHQFQYGTASNCTRNATCDSCKTKQIQNHKKGFVYCKPCDYDLCYNCASDIVDKLSSPGYLQKYGQKGAFMAIKQGGQAAANALAGGVVPGAGDAILMHIQAPYKAAQGDGVGAVKSCVGGFTSLSGAIIGTAVCPGIGTFIGGAIGVGIGLASGYGIQKLVEK